MDRKEYQKERKKRLSTNSVDKVVETVDKITGSVDIVVKPVDRVSTEYPALLYALADPVKRAKLRRISESLKNHGVLQDVTYGIGGPTFSEVSEYLAVLA